MDAVIDLSGAHCHVTALRHDHPCSRAMDWSPLPDWRDLIANRGRLLSVVR